MSKVKPHNGRLHCCLWKGGVTECLRIGVARSLRVALRYNGLFMHIQAQVREAWNYVGSDGYIV